ncbi:MAG TPA: hypothetical protein PLE61_10105 [Vicinamibacterales bacterium]|nr:hypothetical protein [Vicinamibacterales bacterium]
MPGSGLLRSVKFLFTAPILLAFLFLVNLMTSPGHWWVQWAALVLGIAWFFALVRVVGAVVLAGGLAALGVYLFNRRAGASEPAPTSAGAAGTSGLPDIPTVPLRRE